MKYDYTEPTNEQLANFLVIWARSNPRFEHLQVSADVLKHLFNTHPRQREVALKIHRNFQKKIDETSAKLRTSQKDDLMCRYLRPNGKRCVNHAQMGSFFCGLHQDQEQ